MKLKWVSLVALLLCSVTLIAGKVEKLSLHVKQLLVEHQSGRRAAGVKDGRLCAFIKFSTVDEDGFLAAYGCEKVTQIGDIYIANIPVGQLEAMAASDAVERIEANLSGKLANDVIPQWVDTQPVYSYMSQSQGYDGSGVLMGIVDIGFDVTHPTFYATDGTTYRIKGFVDEKAAADETRGIATPLGREYTTQEDILNNKHVGDADANHATHCLGTAVGSGYDTAYRGIAYGADVFAVSSRNAGEDEYANSADQTARMKRIFDYADEVGKPCVITYSIGFNDIPNDSQLFAEALEQLVGPGRILVAAAGNESHKYTYVVKPKGMEAAGCGLNTSTKRERAFLKSDGPFKLKCFSSELNTTDTQAGPVLTDSVTFDSEQLPTDTVALHGHHIMVERSGSFYTMTDRREAMSTGDLSNFPSLLFVIEGKEAEVEVYAAMESGFTKVVKSTDSRFVNPEATHNVGLPGSLSAAVTVGALNGRASYVNYEDKTIDSWGKQTLVGTIAGFSSVGPTKNGLMKPDVVAPGVNIISAGNSYCQNTFGQNMVTKTTFNEREYPWLAMSGTSMATPCVAGIVALWLQADPTLTPDRIKKVLKKTCKPIEVDGLSPNNVYGYGLIDAYAGIKEVLEETSGISDATLLDNHAESPVYYDLQGRRVEHPTHGIYVHQGKKIVIQ